MDEQNQMLESLVTFLIQRNLIDNQNSEAETLSRFLQMWDDFEQDDLREGNASMSQDDINMMFETKAIFTLADFLKSLTANEYYDIAQKIYNEWQHTENQRTVKQLEKLVKIRERWIYKQKSQGFQHWKHLYEFSQLISENEQMRQYIMHLQQNNDALQQERNILELQTKKRNQKQSQQYSIQPLRQSRKQDQAPVTHAQRSASRSHPLSMSLQQDSVPIHERLHREAYKKTQQQVINDVIKHRDELKDCTFKPNTSQGLYSSTQHTPVGLDSRRLNSITSYQREDPFLFERLSKSTKKFNPEVIMLQKEIEEMKDCTFKPETNQKSKYMVNSQDYQDREQFYERLYREGETKEKYKKSLQMLKEHAETNGCTFQPEVNTSRNGSVMGSAVKKSGYSSEDPFTRLHQEHEVKQRSMVKIESEYDQRFKERHPFQPTRVTKQKDQKFVGQRNETSQQRAARMYEEWKQREQKIKEKREELQKEEEKLCKLTLCTSNRAVRRPSADVTNTSQHQTSQMTDNTSQMSSQVAGDRLYNQGKDKTKKVQELRNKIYRESGYSFQPQLNNEANQKYLHAKQNQTVIDRNQQFLEKKEHHLKQIEDSTKCAFQPERITKQSKLSKEWERKHADENAPLGDKLFAKGAEIETKKEKLRQELSIDRNCTFKPQLAKKTDKILRESSGARQGSMHSKSTASLNPLTIQEDRQPFTNRTNNR